MAEPHAAPRPVLPGRAGQAPPRLPFAFARRHGVVVTGGDGTQAQLGCRPETSTAAIAEARRVLGVPLMLELLDGEAFDAALARAYRDTGTGSAAAAESLADVADLADAARELREAGELLDGEHDAPVIRFLNALLAEAIEAGASDVHLEPEADALAVRARIDGVLRELVRTAPGIAPLAASRVKVMARLDIAERRLPQDGRISLRLAGRAVDVRVSTLPSAHGERVVLRLLDAQAARLDLGALGLTAELQEAVATLIARPHGIVLVTGPTGAGKTTTLYAMLTRLCDGARSILTVEDPVEYYLPGIGQTQVAPRVGLSFARGLRAILRQDPDVVMVGEIRDLETAEVAVQASLTGHLVLSTLHTNSAVGAITRLTDMGVEPFLLASSLAGVIAQRLVRRLCPQCRESYRPEHAECVALGLGAEPLRLFRPVGCPACAGTGYRGRSGVYELVLVDAALRALIHDRASEDTLTAQARTRTPSLLADGARRVLAGETSAAELLRVAREG